MLRDSLHPGITGIVVALLTGGVATNLSAQDDANPYNAGVDVRAPARGSSKDTALAATGSARQGVRPAPT